MNDVREVEIAQKEIDRILPGAEFADNFMAILDDQSLTLEQAGRRSFDTSPKWIEALLAIRNIVVKPFGLRGTSDEVKRLRALPKDEVFGFFPVISRTENEIILGFDDSHLDFRIKLYFQHIDGQKGMCAATMVKTHNRFGRFYMFVIKPFHRMIVPAMLKQVA